MRRKIARHRADRPATWPTHESPLDAAGAIAAASTADPPPRAILVDCLTMLASNLLLAGAEASARDRVDAQIAALRLACQQTSAVVLVVTNEVGWGVVPSSSLGRRYRDLLGFANQALAADASRIYLVVAGLPIDCRALSTTPAAIAASLAPNPPETTP